MTDKMTLVQMFDNYGEIETVLDEIERRLSALENAFQTHYHDGNMVIWDSENQGKPEEAGKWQTKHDEVWRAYQNPSTKEWNVDLVRISILDYGDFWMPYDPAHPEPPTPPEVK